jgi:hypothetical protein
MRRESGTISFDHNWLEYENGFGDLDTEFWLGKKDINNQTLKTKKNPNKYMSEIKQYKINFLKKIFVSIMGHW